MQAIRFSFPRSAWSRLGLRARLTLGVGAILLPFALGKAALQIHDAAAEYRHELEEKANTTLDTLSLGLAAYAARADLDGIRALLSATVTQPGVRAAHWAPVERSGEAAAEAATPGRRAPGWFRAWVDLPSLPGEREIVLAGHRHGRLTLVVDPTPWENRLWRLALAEAGFVLLAAVGLFLAIGWLLRSDLGVLIELAHRASRFAAGDHGVWGGPPAALAPEVKAILEAFNQVADTLEAGLHTSGRQQRELAAQLLFTQQLIDAIPIPVYYKDANGIYLGVNPAWEHFFGRPAASMVGRSVAELYPEHPEVAALHEAMDRALWEAGGTQSYEIDVPTTAGMRHTIYTKAVYRHADGTVAGLIGAIVDLTERRQAEAERVAIRQAVEGASDAIAVCDLDGRATFLNPAFVALTGRDRDEVNGLGGVAATLGNPRLKSEVCPTVRAGKAWTGELSVVGAQGEPVPVLLRATPVFAACGKQTGLMATLTDLSRLKRAEALNQRLGRIVDQSLNEIYVFDADTLRFTEVNRGARRNLGYSPHELMAMTPLDIMPDHDEASFEALLAPLRECRREQVRFEAVHRRRDGSEYPVAVSLEFFRRDRPAVFVAMVEDIGERRAAESALRASEEKYRALVETTNDWLWEVDAQGVYTYASPRVRDILGYSPEEVVGRTPFDFMPAAEAQAMRLLFEQIAAARRPLVMLENVNLHKDGRRVVLETSGLPVFDEDGCFRGYRGIDRDVTARRLAQEAFWESEARFENMAANVPGMVFQCQIDGGGRLSFRYVSEGARALCGEAPQTLLDEPGRFLALIPEAERSAFLQNAEASRRAFLGWSWEGRLDIRGEEKWINWRASPRVLDKGTLVWDGLAVDITQARRAQSEVEHSRQQLQALSAYLQAAREEEKARVAREIHDELGGTLTALKMDAYWVLRQLPQDLDRLQERVQAMLGLVDGAVQTTRRICTELRPTVLDDLGLLAAIEWQVAEFEKRTGISCVLCQPTRDVEIPPDMALALFRILQETLTNVVRHAGASRVWVVFQATDEHASLLVEDDGRGITPQVMEAGHSHGLRGMRERVRQFGGQLGITGRPGVGTSIVAQLPLRHPIMEEETS